MPQVITPCCIIIIFITAAANAGLFFPEDLPTALNVAYSRIPSVRTGIDSRYGFGFRIGPNADLQVQWELGPQENTIPLGGGGSKAKKSVKANEQTGGNKIIKNNKDKLSKSTSTTTSTTASASPKSTATSSPVTLVPKSLKSDSPKNKFTRSSLFRPTPSSDPEYGVKRLRKTIMSLFANT